MYIAYYILMKLESHSNRNNIRAIYSLNIIRIIRSISRPIRRYIRILFHVNGINKIKQ